MNQPKPFQGFSIELLKFMHDLENHNNRDWFQKNKPRYESLWLEPALAFIEAMEQPLKRVAPDFRAIPKRTGGSLMRIYRDTRFGNDKSPYKTNMGIHFRHRVGKDVHAPGIYFHLDTRQPFLGVGIWRPDKTALTAIRQRIVEEPQSWKRVIGAKALTAQFERTGESLKRMPRGYEPDLPCADDLRRKDHIAVCNLDLDECLDSDLPELIAKRVKSASGFLRWICQAMSLDD